MKTGREAPGPWPPPAFFKSNIFVPTVFVLKDACEECVCGLFTHVIVARDCGSSTLLVPSEHRRQHAALGRRRPAARADRRPLRARSLGSFASFTRSPCRLGGRRQGCRKGVCTASCSTAARKFHLSTSHRSLAHQLTPFERIRLRVAGASDWPIS